jgi:predicted phage terminase large subunit-like protein
MIGADRRRLAALQDLALTRQATASLRMFVEWAWPILEPATPFQANWHLDLLCEYLEAVTAGEIRRLVINIPPRYGKSLLVSVFWPCWEWVRQPSTRWIFASYAEALAEQHAVQRRRVLLSPWYQTHWGAHVRLARDHRTKLEVHNTQRGTMVATSVGGSITGKGGNRIVIDDPHNPTEVESDTRRQHALDYFTQTLSTRLDDKARDAIVLVMQRLHTRDLSGRCLELGFQHVCLPALAPTQTTIRFPRSGRTIVREADAPLWPAREDVAQLAHQREVLGSLGFAGQYQQEPVPAGGGMFPRTWWRFYDALPPGAAGNLLQSWDLAFKNSDGSDYVVGLVAAQRGAEVFLIDRYKAKVSFTETCRAIAMMQARYPDTHAVLVEDAANGPAVVDALHAQIPGLLLVTPEGGKQARAAAVQPQIEAGQVFLPQPRWPDGTVRPDRAWVDDFMGTCALFPKDAHDDDVDALTQLLVYCRKSGAPPRMRDVLARPEDFGPKILDGLGWELGPFKSPY